MGKNPSFPFYPSDWTRDLDDQELEIEGAWIRICCRLWWSETKGKMTKPIREWARILRKTEKKTIEILKILIEKGVASGEVLINQNPNQIATIINRRMVRCDEISQTRQRVGKLGGNPILLKTENILDNQNPNQKRPPSSSFSSSSSKHIKNPPISPPDFVSAETWTDFMEHRKLLKAPVTNLAAERIFKKLGEWKSEHGWDPNAVLNQSIEKGWKGIVELKDQTSNKFAFLDRIQ